jgi:hypothetical protein
VQINSFVGAAIELEAIRGCSVRLIKTFEGILVKIRHAGAAFELAMLSMADVAELNGRLAELCRAFASSSKSKTMLPLYKRCLKTCDCLYIALQEGNSDKRESAAQATVKVSIDFLTKSIKKITPPSDFNSFQAIDVQAAYKEILPAILQNYRWTRAWSLTDFMLHQRLVDPEFAFAAEHESCIACVDAHNRNAELLIDVIQRQLEQCVHALEVRPPVARGHGCWRDFQWWAGYHCLQYPVRARRVQGRRHHEEKDPTLHLPGAAKRDALGKHIMVGARVQPPASAARLTSFETQGRGRLLHGRRGRRHAEDPRGVLVGLGQGARRGCPQEAQRYPRLRPRAAGAVGHTAQGEHPRHQRLC